MKQYLIFTDLDGTLLDHDTYSWEEARPALELLKQREIPVIFNTSKTLSEVQQLRQEMGNLHPFITENGMITSVPAHYFGDSETDKATHFFHGQPYKAIRRLISHIRREHGFEFIGFGDSSSELIAEMTGLSLEEAQRAGERKASEPLLWRDSQEALAEFKKLLELEGLHLARGGRFFHVSGKGDKGESAVKLLKRYQEHNPEVQWTTVGLGDGLNDLPMLEVVDYPVLVRSQHGAAPDTGHLPHILKTTDTGPRGWNEAILRLLEQ